MKTIYYLAFLLVPTLLFSQKDVLTRADTMPFFAGCEEMDSLSLKRKCSNEALVAFISQNISYPEAARASRIEGTVYVNFIIDEVGNVMNPSIVRDIGAGCGAVALSVINAMPKWEPAKHKGEPVKVKLNLPINFNLKSDQIDRSTKYKLSWGSIVGNEVTKTMLKENTGYEILVRNEFGDLVHVDDLNFAFEKKNYFFDADSNGTINNDLKKVIKKVKSGGKFIISAAVQEDGEFVFVERVFVVK